MTDANGSFVISGVPVGSAQVQTQPLGYDKQVQTVEVAPDATATLAFRLQRVQGGEADRGDPV
jgi:hypothetical protein